MITLFSPSSTVFTTQGLGVLSDPAKCLVIEERNGEFELEMEYPITGIHYHEISLRSIIVAKPNRIDNRQPFRVYKISKPINGKVTINARHISYDLTGIPVMPYSAGSVGAALGGISNNSKTENPFIFVTDKSTEGAFENDHAQSARALLGGQEGSILDVYGGEYKWDGYTVYLYDNRGEDNGVTIHYGKNMIDCTDDEDCSGAYTGVVAYFKKDDVYVESNVMYMANREYDKVYCIDVSSEFKTTTTTIENEDYEDIEDEDYEDVEDEDDIVIIINGDGSRTIGHLSDIENGGSGSSEGSSGSTTTIEGIPTVEELNEKASEYLLKNNLARPSTSMKLNFAQLSDYDEYKGLALLEEVNLCDTIHVIFEDYNINATARINKVVYNVLTNKYESIDIGDPETTLADTIVEHQEELKKINDPNFLEDSIKEATKLITGNLGGYVILHDSDNDGKPDEILIMDTPNIATATNVWRWNQAGLMHANSYTGTYTNAAITMDGKISADFITAGTMSANRVRAGTLESNSGRFVIDLTNNTMTIRNANNATIFSYTESGGLSVSGTLTANNSSFTSERIIMNPSSKYGSVVIGDVSDYNYDEVTIWVPESYTSGPYYDGAIGNLGSGGHAWAQVVARDGWFSTVHRAYEVSTSSERYKKDIEDLDTNLYDFDSIRPVSFKFKNGSDKPMIGFIAEECEEYFKTAVSYNNDGLPEAISYDFFIPVLVKELQNLKKRVEELEEKLNEC